MTIETLLGASAIDLEKMDTEQLRSHLKDIIDLEPKPFGRVIIDQECPIKRPAKKKTKLTKLEEEAKLIKEMEEDLKNL